ncbi:hypothetical protein ACFQY5_30995 [Paeniroseomonas aquatica]|uniref:Uncharacterized protein n=1 Tax=Paeniroseomonas aquatica TaxID=373043 RepID=A0ABT7ZZA8_9PROT|nr:hypothetical protein [Paeniroseomonas aquatica]MDN3562809.1 hypothetical protein [Paeniroseomonas aquatica]
MPQSAPATAAILPFPEKPEDRLRRALHGLEAALAEQAEAVAGLRRELGALAEAVDGLGGSFDSYAEGLQETKEALAGAGDQARQLEATADAMLAAAAR